MVLHRDRFQSDSSVQASVTIFPIQSADQGDMGVLNLENNADSIQQLLIW